MLRFVCMRVFVVYLCVCVCVGVCRSIAVARIVVVVLLLSKWFCFVMWTMPCDIHTQTHTLMNTLCNCKSCIFKRFFRALLPLISQAWHVSIDISFNYRIAFKDNATSFSQHWHFECIYIHAYIPTTLGIFALLVVYTRGILSKNRVAKMSANTFATNPFREQ